MAMSVPLAEAREYREATASDIFGSRLALLTVVGGQSMILCSVELMQRMARFTLVPTANICVGIRPNVTEENR